VRRNLLNIYLISIQTLISAAVLTFPSQTDPMRGLFLDPRVGLHLDHGSGPLGVGSSRYLVSHSKGRGDADALPGSNCNVVSDIHVAGIPQFGPLSHWLSGDIIHRPLFHPIDLLPPNNGYKHSERDSYPSLSIYWLFTVILYK
jgi:hypothetical protein